MTMFRRSNDVEVSISPEFDKEYEPEATPVHSGIYRCRGCGCEIVAQGSKPFPAENHPRHSGRFCESSACCAPRSSDHDCKPHPP